MWYFHLLYFFSSDKTSYSAPLSCTRVSTHRHLPISCYVPQAYFVIEKLYLITSVEPTVRSRLRAGLGCPFLNTIEARIDSKYFKKSDLRELNRKTKLPVIKCCF